MAKKKTTKTQARAGSKLRREVLSRRTKEVHELGLSATQIQREREKAHAFRDQIETEWTLSLALGGIVRLKFENGPCEDGMAYLSIDAARRLAAAIALMSERVPPEDESADCLGCSACADKSSKPKRGRPKKKTKTTRRKKTKAS